MQLHTRGISCRRVEDCRRRTLAPLRAGADSGTAGGSSGGGGTAHGKCWLVGAGPGPSDLLTLRAVRALESAQVVVVSSRTIAGPGHAPPPPSPFSRHARTQPCVWAPRTPARQRPSPNTHPASPQPPAAPSASIPPPPPPLPRQYDDLGAQEALALAPPSAELLYVGKRGGVPSIKQGEIDSLIVDRTRQVGPAWGALGLAPKACL